MVPLEIRIIRSNEISEFEWLFHIYRRDGQFQAVICDGTLEAEPIGDWEPELDDEEAYRAYCEQYLDQLIQDRPETAYGYASELIHAVELLDTDDDDF